MAGAGALRGTTAAVALLLAACTSGAPAADPSTSESVPSAGPTPSISVSGTGATPTPSGTGSGGAGAPGATTPPAPPRTSRLLRFTSTVRIPLRGQTYGRGLVLWGRYAAWVGCDGCQKTFTEPGILYVADLTARTVRAVATLPSGGGSLVPIGGAGSRLVYAVADRRGRDGWTLQTLDLTNGARSVLARAPQADDTIAPVAVAGDGRVAWQTFPDGSTGAPHGPVTAVDLGTGARTTVSRDVTGLLAGVIRTGIVYRTTRPAEDDASPPDGVMLLRRGRGQPLSLSGPFDVQDVVTDDSTVVWQTTDGPGAGLWAVPLDGSRVATQFYRGGTGDRAVGTGFLALVTSGDYPVLLMYPLGGGPMAAVGDVPGEFGAIAADGRRLAYIALPGERGVQPDAEHPITLVVGTVRLPDR